MISLTRDEKIECMVDVLITLLRDVDFEEALKIARKQISAATSINTPPQQP